ncbi:MAG: DedA family protein [Candidatus Methylomirabilales bacterium]
MFTPAGFLDQWGYFAVVTTVTLGNLGVPVPEKSLLVLAGYLAAAGYLHPLGVASVGVLSAVAAAGITYYAARRWGRRRLEGCLPPALLAAPRFQRASGLVHRYGALGVIAARFVPGMRVLSGPAAVLFGIRPAAFLLAILCSAAYIPLLVGLGYLVGR